MASPFPGMDPYLEQFWRDVHASLIIYSRDQLNKKLPSDLRARVEERVILELPDQYERSVFPDVRVVERGFSGSLATQIDSHVEVAEPLLIHREVEPMTETRVEIVDAGSGKKVITVIEFLSPSNKFPGDGQEQYLRKQQELCAGRVSLVEIDLVRAGEHVLAVNPHAVPREFRTPYKACVRRGWKLEVFEYYRLPLRERLPAIRIPLRESDRDVALDLQALIDQCYRNGGYDDDIDYRVAPKPPLTADDAAWADELLRQHGYR